MACLCLRSILTRIDIADSVAGLRRVTEVATHSDGTDGAELLDLYLTIIYLRVLSRLRAIQRVVNIHILTRLNLQVATVIGEGRLCADEQVWSHCSHLRVVEVILHGHCIDHAVVNQRNRSAIDCRLRGGRLVILVVDDSIRRRTAHRQRITIERQYRRRHLEPVDVVGGHLRGEQLRIRCHSLQRTVLNNLYRRRINGALCRRCCTIQRVVDGGTLSLRYLDSHLIAVSHELRCADGVRSLVERYAHHCRVVEVVAHGDSLHRTRSRHCNGICIVQALCRG